MRARCCADHLACPLLLRTASRAPQPVGCFVIAGVADGLRAGAQGGVPRFPPCRCDCWRRESITMRWEYIIASLTAMGLDKASSVQRPGPVAAAVDAVCGQRSGRAEPGVRRPPRWRSDAPSWYSPESELADEADGVQRAKDPVDGALRQSDLFRQLNYASRRERPDRSRRIVAARWIDWISLLIARAPQTGGRTVRRVGRSAVRCGRVRRAVGGRGPRHGDGRRWRAGSRPG